MYLHEISTHERIPVTIELVNEKDFKTITKKDFSFNWRLEKHRIIYKLSTQSDGKIMGLMSLEYIDSEHRIAIGLISARNGEIGSNKKHERIAGNLFAFAGKNAFDKYGPFAVISLVPKTKLRNHYIKKYGFCIASENLYLDGSQLEYIINKYGDD
jgi:hypothetical protein